ncbi:MAG: peptidylprolyl isomerase [Bacteroidetes bacterium]|nr:peptidylprolyl isomerase [Bacteroidota bacterium]
MRNIILLMAFTLMALIAQAQTHEAEIVTNYGKIRVMLYDGTPLHRDNFIKLVNEHKYDSLLFHRVIKGFMIQAGDPNSKLANDTALLGDGDLGYTVPAEIMPDKYYHKRGALAAARDDNPKKESSAIQFYIVQGQVANDSTFIKAKKRSGGYEIPEEHKQVYRSYGGVPRLDSQYTVFGEVVKGMAVVDDIASSLTDANDRPKKNIRIKTVRMVK